MDSVTSAFEYCLAICEARTRDLPLVPSLALLSRLIGQCRQCRFWFVEIQGQRRSFLAGQIRATPCAGGLEFIPLRGGRNSLQLVLAGRGLMTDGERDLLVQFVERLLDQKRPARRSERAIGVG
jgi:hypothetical protein